MAALRPRYDCEDIDLPEYHLTYAVSLLTLISLILLFPLLTTLSPLPFAGKLIPVSPILFVCSTIGSLPSSISGEVDLSICFLPESPVVAPFPSSVSREVAAPILSLLTPLRCPAHHIFSSAGLLSHVPHVGFTYVDASTYRSQ